MWLIHNLGLKERSFIVVSILTYIPVLIYRSFSSVLTAFILHMWSEHSRRVYFTNFWQGYINVRKKAEEGGETRGETREET